jgi:hypothetical protein
MNIKLPATRRELLEASWTQLETRACRLCGAEIEFWRSDTGAKHPLEVRFADDWKLGTHFETCPKASEFRKPKTASPQEKKQGDLFK